MASKLLYLNSVVNKNIRHSACSSRDGTYKDIVELGRAALPLPLDLTRTMYKLMLQM